jgi:outer membrane protein OmpA-like peptidoglycan-associated protein
MPFWSPKYRLLLSLALHSAILGAQNLIKNPSFEEKRECPARLGNFHVDVPDWSSPTEASTDYFNACSESMGIPENFNGSQLSEFGRAYAGLYLFAPNDYREYVQGELTETLVKDAVYEVGFYLSLAERSDFAIREMGLVFSRNKIELAGKKELSKMQLYRDRGNTYKFLQVTHPDFLDETDRWVYLKVEYTASGDENFITIGNLENNARTLTRRTSRNAKQGAYYYLDMVSVTPVGTNIEIAGIKKPPAGEGDYAMDTEYQFRHVLFGFDDYRLNAEAKMEIRTLFNFLLQYEDVSIIINGHTDNVGSDGYNRNLAASRCRSVANYLLELGLEGDRIRWESHGYAEPVEDNTTEEGRMRNRRVAFSLSRTD